MARAAITVWLLVVLAACVAPPGEDLALRYQHKARELGLFPVYPPREEFQVGDVYLWSRSATNADDVETVWIHSLPWIQHEAEVFLRSRLVFTETAASGKQTEDLFAGRMRTRGDQRTLSLPITAFPEITADAGFTGGGTLARLGAALGLAGGNRTTVTLSFGDVRTYWVPHVRVAQRVNSELIGVVPFVFEQAEVQLNRLLQIREGRPVAACSSGRFCGVTVVTRVYLTRKITYTYRSAAILAAARTRFVTQPATGTTPSAVSVNLALPGGDGTADMQGQIAALKTQVDALARSGAPGESVAFQSWDASGLKFSEQFLRPVAIGWDGFDFELREQGGTGQ